MLQTGCVFRCGGVECLLDEEQRIVEGHGFCVYEGVGFTVVRPGCQHQDEGFKHLRHVDELCGDRNRSHVFK